MLMQLCRPEFELVGIFSARPRNSKWIPDYKILNPESQDSENPSGIGIAS